MKKLCTIFLTITCLLSLGQDPCTYPGDNERWSTNFVEPGAGVNNIFVSLTGNDGYIYFGGSYSNFGGDTEYDVVVRYDGERYLQLGQGFQCQSCGTGSVRALAKDSIGNIYIGGFFDAAVNFDGSVVPSHNLVKWNIQTETYEAIGAGAGINNVRSLFFRNDTLYVGGSFDEVYNLTDTITAEGIALYDFNAGLWSAMPNGPDFVNGTVDIRDIKEARDGKIMVSGFFNKVDTLSGSGVARWNPHTGWDNFGGGPIQTSSSGPFPANVYAIEPIPNTDLVYAVGSFGEYSGSASTLDKRGFGYWDGNAWVLRSGFGKPSGFSGWNFNDLLYVPEDSSLYIGGSFKKYTTQYTQNLPVGDRIAKLHIPTNTLTEVGGGTKINDVRSISYWNNKLVIIGASAVEEDSLGVINMATFDGQTWDNMGNGLSGGNVKSLNVFGDRVYLMGDLNKIDGLEAPNLVRWEDANGWTFLDYNIQGAAASNYAKVVNTVEEIGDKLWIGGQFASIDTFTTNSLANVDMLTGEITTFGAGVAGVAPRVDEIIEFQNEVFIAGRFTSVDGVPTVNVAKYGNGTWSSIGDFSGEVYAFENQGDSLLFIGGVFNSVDGDNSLKRLVVYNGDSVYNLAGGISSGTVRDIVTDANGILHIGGSISNPKQSDGSYLNGYFEIVQYYNGRYMDTMGLDLNSAVYCMAADADGRVYFGGEFASFDPSIELNKMGVWHPQMGVSTLGTGVTNKRSGISVIGMGITTDGALFLGGDMRRVGINQSAGIARYQIEDSVILAPVFAFADSIQGCDSAVVFSGITGSAVNWSNGETGETTTVYQSGWLHAQTTTSWGCFVEDSVYVTLFASPDFSHLPDTVQACADSLLLSAPAGYVTYNWTNGDSTQTTKLDTGLHEVNFLAIGSNGCSNSHTYYVFVDPFPMVDLGQDTGFCGEGLIGTSISANSYLWNTGDTNQFLAVDSAGVYVLTSFNALGCSTMDSVEVEIYNDPIANIPDTVQACAPLTLDAGAEFVGYYWNTNDTTQTITLGPGTYNLQLSVIDTNGCSNTQMIYAQVDTLPEIHFVGGDSLCGPGNLGLYKAYADVLWSTGDSSQTILVHQTGWYTATVINDKGCTSTDSVFRTVLTPNNTMFNQDTILACDSLILSVLPGFNNLTWSTGDTTQSILVATSNSYYITGTDANGCSVSDEVYVLINALSPNSSFTHFIDMDSTSQVNFVADSSTGMSTYYWNFGDGSQDSGRTVSHVFTQNGSFTIVLVVLNECGADSSAQTLTISGIGIEEISLGGFNYYPNPSNGVLEIESTTKGVLSILTISGQLVHQEHLTSSKTTIDGTRFPSGMYLLRLEQENGRVRHEKWVKR